MRQEPITIQVVVNAPISSVWECWTVPENINGWAFASDDWEAHAEENDLRPGGKFKTVMGAKDKSAGFDFTGTYTAVKEPELIEYDLDDGRHVKIVFEELPEGVKITQTFDPESVNTLDKQRSGWQAFLDNFKKFTENKQRA